MPSMKLPTFEVPSFSESEAEAYKAKLTAAPPAGIDLSSRVRPRFSNPFTQDEKDDLAAKGCTTAEINSLEARARAWS